MDRFLLNGDQVVEINQPSGTDLDLVLKGENTNANELRALRHRATSFTNGIQARAAGLKDTQLVTRQIADINLDVSAHARGEANFGWGMNNVLLEADRNRLGIAMNINVIGSSSANSDPTFRFIPPWRFRDPVFGMSATTAELSEFADNVSIRAEAEAGNWSNTATAYGINGGNDKAQRTKIEGQLSKAPALRKALSTNGGDDNLTINTLATNSGASYQNPFDRAAESGRQRAVGIFNSYVDLGTGNDNVTLRSEVLITGGVLFPRAELGFIQLPGAHTIRAEKALFDGVALTTNDFQAAASADLFESVLSLGDGNDNVSLYNGWESDIQLGSGDDNVTVSSGKELFITGGAGNDTVEIKIREDIKKAFSTFRDPVYAGVKDNLHVIQTDEGNIYLKSDVENLKIQGQVIALDPIKGAEPTVLSLVESTVEEGKPIRVIVRRSGPLNGNASATVALSSGTAEEGSDFGKETVQVSFVPGQSEAIAGFKESIDDKIVETSETIKATLSTTTPDVLVPNPESIVTLTDNDKERTRTSFNIADAIVDEGKTALVKVTRVGDTSEQQTVQVTTRSVLPTSAADYKGGTFTGAFLPGETEIEIAIDTVDDTENEAGESFQVVGAPILSSGAAETRWERAQAVVNITDNDAVKPVSTYSFEKKEVDVEEGKAVTIVVKRTGDLSATQIALVSTIADGDATDDDFEEKTYTLVFPKGKAEQSITIKTKADSKADPNETFSVVSGPVASVGSSSVEGEWAEGTVKVKITEPAPVGSISAVVNESAIDEGATLNVNITGEGLKPGSRAFYRIAGEGIDAKDFEGGPLSGPVRIAANGSVKMNLTRTAVKDYSSDENDEVAQIQIFEDALFTKPLTQPTEVVVRDTSIGVAGNWTFDDAVSNYKIGTEGTDKLVVTKEEANRAWALWGQGGKDTLVGGRFDDYLVGGKGIDNLTGGGGSDKFILEDLDPKNNDIITDFNPREDVITIPVDIFDANPEDELAVVRYRDVSNKNQASKTFEKAGAQVYLLVDTFANIKKVNSTNYEEAIYLAVDTKGRKLMMDDDGNWFKGSTVLATFGGKGALTSLTPNNFALGFQWGSSLNGEEKVVEEITDNLVDPLA